MKVFLGHSYSDQQFEELFGSSRSKAAPAPERPTMPAQPAMSQEERHALIANIMAAVGKGMKQHVAEQMAARDTEISALRLRMAAMEARMEGKSAGDALVYRGVWTPNPDHPYLPGNFVTWEGSMWACMTKTAHKPGDGHDNGWRLAVKRGAPGKDGGMLRHSGVAEPRR